MRKPQLIYIELPRPNCPQGSRCDIVENPSHWVQVELSKRDRALFNIGLRFVSTFRHDIENDIPVSGSDAVDCIQSLWGMFKKEAR